MSGRKPQMGLNVQAALEGMEPSPPQEIHLL